MSPVHFLLYAAIASCLCVEPALSVPAQPETEARTPEDARAERARRRIQDRQAAEARAQRAQSRVDEIRNRIFWLADPDRQGRGPGSDGIAAAADEIEDAFLGLGLEPAFPTEITTPDGTIVVTPNATYRQAFQYGQTVEAIESRLSVVLPDGTIRQASDFEVSVYSSTSDFSGPAMFVGYGIVTGGSGYLGFVGTEDLREKVVIMLSHEPMDELGRSLWSDNGWSFAAPLHRKIGAAVRRGAKAVLVVEPPDLNEALTGSADPIGQTREQIEPFEVPIVHISAALADEILRAGDPEHRSLEQLYRRANREGTVVDMPGVTVAVQTAVQIEPAMTDNIGAVLRGRGPLADEYIVIGAHYDHVGLGATDGRDPQAAGQVHPGADDNASGTSAMLAAADELVMRYDALAGDQPARSVLFLAFSAEELGLVGSRFYVEHPIVPMDDQVLMLNMDMVGRYADNGLQIGGFESSADLGPFVEPHAMMSGLEIVPLDPTTAGRSDHASFNDKGVPNLFFFTGFHDQYHTVHDTADLVDIEGVARIADLVADLAFDAATWPERFEFDRGTAGGNPNNAPEQPAERVRTGIVPTVRSSGEGMLVARIAPGTSAEAAGLRPGDRITRWGDTPIDSVETWSGLLETLKPGDRVRVEYTRSGETHTTELLLKGEDE